MSTTIERRMGDRAELDEPGRRTPDEAVDLPQPDLYTTDYGFQGQSATSEEEEVALPEPKQPVEFVPEHEGEPDHPEVAEAPDASKADGDGADPTQTDAGTPSTHAAATAIKATAALDRSAAEDTSAGRLPQSEPDDPIQTSRTTEESKASTAGPDGPPATVESTDITKSGAVREEVPPASPAVVAHIGATATLPAADRPQSPLQTEAGYPETSMATGGSEEEPGSGVTEESECSDDTTIKETDDDETGDTDTTTDPSESGNGDRNGHDGTDGTSEADDGNEEEQAAVISASELFAGNYYIEEIGPGAIITVADSGEARQLEDWIARQISPNATATEWQAWQSERTDSLTNLLRPPGFIGKMVGVTLRRIPDAYDALFEARNLGWQFAKDRGMPPYRRTATDEGMRVVESDRHVGFHVCMTAKSSRGVSTTTEAVAWYIPAPRMHVSGRGPEAVYHTHHIGSGSAVRRVVTKTRVANPDLVRGLLIGSQLSYVAAQWEELRRTITNPSHM